MPVPLARARLPRTFWNLFLEVGPLPQIIKSEFHPAFFVEWCVLGPEGPVDLIPFLREGALALGIQVGLDIR